MSTTNKGRVSMRQIYEDAAGIFRADGNTTPTHTDVRCYVNDLLDSYDRDGFTVNFDYSQDKAFLAVRRLLGTGFAK